MRSSNESSLQRAGENSCLNRSPPPLTYRWIDFVSGFIPPSLPATCWAPEKSTWSGDKKTVRPWLNEASRLLEPARPGNLGVEQQRCSQLSSLRAHATGWINNKKPVVASCQNYTEAALTRVFRVQWGRSCRAVISVCGRKNEPVSSGELRLRRQVQTAVGENDAPVPKRSHDVPEKLVEKAKEGGQVVHPEKN